MGYIIRKSQTGKDEVHHAHVVDCRDIELWNMIDKYNEKEEK